MECHAEHQISEDFDEDSMVMMMVVVMRLLLVVMEGSRLCSPALKRW